MTSDDNAGAKRAGQATGLSEALVAKLQPDHSDAELLARVAAFRCVYDESKSTSDTLSTIHNLAGEAAKAVFAIPAQTVRGALEKLKIVYLAVGNGKANPEDAGDYDLALYQTSETSWFAIAIADLERLTGQRVISPEHDPVVDLAKRLTKLWRDKLRLDQNGIDAVARGERQPGDPDPEFERVERESIDVEDKLVATPAQSVAGALAQLLLASNYADIMASAQMPDRDDAGMVSRLLRSMRGVLERESGVLGEDFAAEPGRFNPFSTTSIPRATGHD